MVRVGFWAWIYRKLGPAYPPVYLAVELLAAIPITIGAIALLSFYYDGTWGEYLLIAGICCALTLVAIAVSVLRTIPVLKPIKRWIAGERDPDSTAQAWASAVGLPLHLIKRDMPVPVFLTALPSVIAGVIVLDLSWLAFFPISFATAIVLIYSAMLHYLAVEAGMRPVLVDINQQISPRLSVTGFSALPLRVRLMVALPLINLITGLVVAALTSDGGGGASLGVDVMIALAVATTVSLELTVMLSKSILRPINDLERAVKAIEAGDYSVSIPVTTGDEFGEVAASFNSMVEGLRERERIREAFGTYLDREVAEYILSDGFDEEGVEIEVSILFCDVRDFTRFAADATPQQVVAALNRLFEVIVPIIAEHGGHVDKFEGDGLLAVFGAPEPYLDHADRAVRAACEIAAKVNAEGEAGELRVGIGVNTGRVVAGAIGGAGRLNFSVIGGAVNVAARVEELTRQTEDDILITPETWTALSHRFEAESRGKVELKGIAEPVTVYAPHLVGPEEPAEAEAAAGAGDGEGPLDSARGGVAAARRALRRATRQRR
ncbi:MAG: adenylate/guanylate cyclase domain-containing protein [Solirubrobacterales bacterium]